MFEVKFPWRPLGELVICYTFLMSGKSVIGGGMLVGSTIGGCVPYLWDGGLLSYIVFSTLGGFLGIYLGFKLAKWTGAL